jgi:hypothetical protein
MPLKRKIKVVKVPLDRKPEIIMPNFPIMPRLYLEQLENKTKVRPEMIGKDYNPPELEHMMTEIPVQPPVVKEEFKFTSPETDDKKSRQKSRSLRIVDLESSSGIGSKEEYKPEPKKKIEVDNDDTILGVFSKKSEEKKSEEKYEDNEEHREDRSDRKEKHRSNDGLSRLLRGDINKTDSQSVSQSSNQPVSQSNSQSNNQSNSQPILEQPKSIQINPNIPPSLSEINSGKPMVEGGVRNLSYLTKVEEEEISKKRDLLHKFQRLRRIYPGAKIPEFTEHSDLKMMEREYDFILKDLEISQFTEQWKQYLVMAFKGLEVFLINFMEFDDIQGFAQQQATKIHKYESILAEIGEKNYISDNKKWPPELRLLGLFLSEAVMFIGIKYMSKMVSGGNSSKKAPEQSFNRNYSPYDPSAQPTFNAPPSQGQKKTFRGPDIDLDEFEKKNI